MQEGRFKSFSEGSGREPWPCIIHVPGQHFIIISLATLLPHSCFLSSAGDSQASGSLPQRSFTWVSQINSFSYSCWVCSDTRKVGAQFTAHCRWKGLLEHPSPHGQLWGWEGAVLLYKSFCVYGVSPPKTSAIVVNITTFPAQVEQVPVYISQHASMCAVIYFSLAPPPNRLFHQLSMVA